MSKSGVIRCLLAIMLAIYLGFALFIAHDMAAREKCAGFDVHVLRVPGAGGYMTAAEVGNLLGEWGFHPEGKPVAQVRMQAIEDRLNAMDNVEEALVERTAGRKVKVTVTPMIPVARVFDKSGSYYINRQGKRLTANARFRLDVPLITGTFDSVVSPRSLLPLISRISNDSAWNAIVAQIQVEPVHKDIILVPMIRGHVINLGDTSRIDDKLSRVMLMYRKVLPLKGWQYYDTLSVKWAGQVVATRRQKGIPEPLIQFDTEGDEEEDVNSMLTSPAENPDTVNPDSRPRHRQG